MLLPLTRLVQLILLVTFGAYGIGSLFWAPMVAEFERFGTKTLRLWTGGLQVAGSAGLLLGFLVPSLALCAAVGFTAMMGVALVVRYRLRDPLRAAIPALVLFGLSAFLAISLFWGGAAGPVAVG